MSLFFIVGSARSGTTLLRMMLNAHSDLAVPPESRFLVDLWRGRRTVEVEPLLRSLERHALFKTWGISIDAVRAELNRRATAPYAEVVEAPYRVYATARGKTCWGDKTPRYIEHIPLLADLFPGAPFVHLVRDGRNVALSYADVPFGPKSIAKAAELWGRRVSAGMHAGRALGADRYIEIRYETLVDNPEQQAARLCRFLGIAFDPGMLDYPARARHEVLPRAARYNPRVTERPMRQVRSWEQEMPDLHVEVFEAVAGDVLSSLGYPRRYPAPRRRARVAASLGKLGAPIGRIRALKTA